MSSERRKRVLAGAGGFVLAFGVGALLGATGVIRVTAPGGAHPGAGPDPPEGYNLTDEDASVRGLTFRRGWVDVELRVRYGEEWFVVEGFGRGRRLLAEAMRSSGRRYAAEQLGGSVVVLQCGRPTGALRWKVRLELDTPDGRHGRQFAAALSFSDLDGAAARLGRATPAGGERAVGLLGFSPVGVARKPVAVELVYRPIDVTSVGAEGGRERKGRRAVGLFDRLDAAGVHGIGRRRWDRLRIGRDK